MPPINRLEQQGAQSYERMGRDVYAIAEQNRRVEQDALDAERLARAEKHQSEQDTFNTARIIRSEQRQSEQDVLDADRMARAEKSRDLTDEVRKYDFEKEKAFDENAMKRKIINDKRAIEATNSLFSIDSKAEDAPDKLAKIGMQYSDLLDPQNGDKRFISQFGYNQKLTERHAETKAKADELSRIEKEKAAGTITIDDEGKQTIRRPLQLGEAEKLTTGKERQALLEKHNKLEQEVNGRSGSWLGQNKEKVTELEQLKAQLGWTNSGPAPTTTAGQVSVGGIALNAPVSPAPLVNVGGIPLSGSAPAPVTVTPAVRVVVNPQTGEKRRLENGQWVPHKP